MIRSCLLLLNLFYSDFYVNKMYYYYSYFLHFHTTASLISFLVFEVLTADRKPGQRKDKRQQRLTDWELNLQPLQDWSVCTWTSEVTSSPFKLVLVFDLHLEKF